MIQLREDIAWVCVADGKRTPFDNQQLIGSIQRAIGDQLLAESIANAIYRYACDTNTISTAEIAKLVVTALTLFGLADCANAYRHRDQFAEIRLDQLAGSEAFELGFYRQLDHALRSLTTPARLNLSGLRACVMRLRGAQRWGESCRTLADEIVGFVRDRIQQVSIEVTE